MDEEIEFNDEEDGSVSIDFRAGQGKMLAISIEPNGEICWALHWDGHKEHGTHKTQQRTWVGLTDEERNHARQTVTYLQIAMTANEWTEALQIETEKRLKEKNK
jgi:hypothetical protein